MLQFAAGLVTEPSTCPPKVVRCKGWKLALLGLLLYDSPNDFRGETGSPNSASLVDRTQESPRSNSSRRCPRVDPIFHPVWNWNGSHVAALADEIGYHPMFLSLLQVFDAQRGQFRPTKSATQQRRWSTWRCLPLQLWACLLPIAVGRGLRTRCENSSARGGGSNAQAPPVPDLSAKNVVDETARLLYLRDCQMAANLLPRAVCT